MCCIYSFPQVTSIPFKQMQKSKSNFNTQLLSDSTYTYNMVLYSFPRSHLNFLQHKKVKVILTLNYRVIPYIFKTCL